MLCRGPPRCCKAASPHPPPPTHTPHPHPRRPPPAGISLRTQELYAIVFVCRYLDLFYSYVSL